MNQETRVAKELQRMMTSNEVPVSAQEDINEICESLVNSSSNLKDLENRDPFIVEMIHKAINLTGDSTKF